jgi:hypothetical protein
MFVTKKYVEVDLKLDTKALSRDGIKANGHCDRINEDPKTTCWPYLNFAVFIVKPHISKALQIVCI